MAEPPLDPLEVLDLPRSALPRHIAIIMDGNGRWATQRQLPRIHGHAEGAKVVDRIVTQCARLGIDALTLYSFSQENWKRPRREVDFLMALYGRYLIEKRETIVGNNVRLVHIGRRDGIPGIVLDEMDRTIEASQANSGLRLCLALNYGARCEIVDAVRRIANLLKENRLDAESIDEDTIQNALYTAGIVDPDLVIRTSGEMRISNFLLWQISYAELYVCDALWPDFGVDHLSEAIREFARRRRRFGNVDE